jgi:hypothetical protein
LYFAGRRKEGFFARDEVLAIDAGAIGRPLVLDPGLSLDQADDDVHPAYGLRKEWDVGLGGPTERNDFLWYELGART